jgi:acyl-CoA thioesterase-1
MVEMIKSRKAVPVLVTIPPISSERFFKWFSRRIDKKDNILKWLKDINFIYRSQEMYSEVIRKTAIELGCVLIDIRGEFLRQRDYQKLLCADGIHPNEEGHRLMARTFVEFAESHI